MSDPPAQPSDAEQARRLLLRIRGTIRGADLAALSLLVERNGNASEETERFWNYVHEAYMIAESLNIHLLGLEDLIEVEPRLVPDDPRLTLPPWRPRAPDEEKK